MRVKQQSFRKKGKDGLAAGIETGTANEGGADPTVRAVFPGVQRAEFWNASYGSLRGRGRVLSAYAQECERGVLAFGHRLLLKACLRPVVRQQANTETKMVRLPQSGGLSKRFHRTLLDEH